MNLGARDLDRKRVGTIDDLAESLGVDRTYAGRILSDKRRPGLALRRKIRDQFGIPLEHWDKELADAKQPRNLRNASTDS